MRSAGTHRKVSTHAAKTYRLKRRIKYILVILAVSALVCFLVYYTLGPRNPSIIDTTPKIAIVDHLSTQWPRQTFNQTVQNILNQTGLQIDYYPSEDVTVDFYRDLPKHNYKLMIFRVHSTGESSVEGTPPFVVFFTSENYSNTAHVSEQMDMRVVYVQFPNATLGYFGITPRFVTDSMEGRFNDTVIIAMGCDGLKYDTMAEAFIQKGAKAFISWNGSVSIDHTDEATVSLLRHLVTEHQTFEEAVAQTMNEVGPDPADRSILLFYPDKARDASLLLANTTIATPPVKTTRKSINRENENSLNSRATI